MLVSGEVLVSVLIGLLVRDATTHLGRAFPSLTESAHTYHRPSSSQNHISIRSQTPEAKLIEQMAEVLGVVASGISVAQIAGQLLGCVQQLRTLCRALRDTPGELQGILDELEILGEVFYQLRALQIDSSQPGYSALRASLGHCRMAASKLETIAVAGSRALQDSKKRAWFLMKAVLRREEVRELKVQLEAAKSLLHLAMTCYSL